MRQQERVIAVGGVDYHVDDYGDGRPVLLLHGMPDTASVWRKQVPALVAAGFRAIAPDMLGYGRTDKPAEVARYSGERVVADLLGLIEALELEQLDVVGHDWGAFASWNLVTLAPQTFRRHVALQVGHPSAFLEDLSARVLKENWYMYVNAMPGAEELYRAADFAYPRTLFATHPDRDEVIARLREPGALRGHLNWDAANPLTLMYANALEARGVAAECSVPTLGVWSSGDAYLWEAQVANSHRYMRAPWRYQRLDSGSHWVMLDNPEPVTRSIIEWLSAAEVAA
jgi:pimeloyl-ACP methyl ester carboxylesterase